MTSPPPTVTATNDLSTVGAATAAPPEHDPHVDDEALPSRGKAFLHSAAPWVVLIVKSLLRMVAVILLVSLATLALLDHLPGGPIEAILGTQATPEQVKVLTHDLGLDKPFTERYVDWLDGIVSGDLGRSTFTQEKVTEVIKQRIPVTLELALGTLIVALLIAIPSAVYAASRPGGWFDRAVSVLGSFMIAIPSFIMAVLLLYLLAVKFQVFPALGWVPISENLGQNFEHAFLPVMSLALLQAAIFTRLLRGDMVATLNQDFILAARARGLPRRRVLFGHALRPSCFSLMTVAGVTLGQLIGATVIVEFTFTLPGLGAAAVQSIQTRDYVLLRGIIVVMSISFVLINTLVDLAYPLLDPRVRTQGAS